MDDVEVEVEELILIRSFQVMLDNALAVNANLIFTLSKSCLISVEKKQK